MHIKFNRLTKLLLPLFSIYILLLSGCENPECKVDADCTDAVCSTEGTCVACNASSDCGADSFCCQNECFAEDTIEAHCGCSATGSNEGTKCGNEKNICLGKDGKRITADKISDGVCSCSCSPLEGGTLCALDDTNENGYKCECSPAEDAKTCGSVVKDDKQQLHIPADTCTSENSCVCLSEGATCGTGNLAADCSKGKCVDLNDDENNCGTAGRQCSESDQGLDNGNGICVSGGCQCNNNADCKAENLNVDTCSLDTDVGKCVCDTYKDGDLKAACPLGLECTDAGCMYVSVPVKSRKELLILLGQAPETSN